MKVSAPLSVCWDITSRCNDNCSFCYRVISNQDLRMDGHLLILRKLLAAGVRKISFVGGESLLLEHLPLLLREAYTAGAITSVVTNGSLLRERWPELRGYVHWVTLPLDGPNATIQRAMSRMAGHFERVVDTLAWLSHEPVALKVNTVVSAINADAIDAIARLIRQAHVQRWKLFQFFGLRGSARRTESHYAIDRKEYFRAIKTAVEQIQASDCHVTLADHEYLQRNYFSISPDGSVRTTVCGEDVTLGNLLTDEVSNLWIRPEFDHRKHMANRWWLVPQADLFAGADRHLVARTSVLPPQPSA